MVGFGLIAVNLSGTSYIGIAGAGYAEGVAVWNYEWMAALVLAFFALFILPFYLRTKVATAPEFLERRYDRRSRVTFSRGTLGGATTAVRVRADRGDRVVADSVPVTDETWRMETWPSSMR